MTTRTIARLACCLALACALFATTQRASANPPDNRVVLQAFYWDCKNTRYATQPDGTGGWYAYLARLMPRLKEFGFDGVWTPPPCKGNTAIEGMGYDLLDHYDLGQKFQCGARHGKPKTPTRFGDQDAFLRMIAVAHANGLEIYPDIVLNHCDGGAEDPAAPHDKFKKFRYPAFGGGQAGRWPKDWQNFHPNAQHGWLDDDWRHILVGADICYHGRCADHPVDDGGNDVMRVSARQWLVWLKRQSDVDGFRFDAVKHFPPEVVEDVLFNAMDAGKPDERQRKYFAVGEYVGTAAEEDAWANQTRGRCGTFDFAFRQALFDMIRGGGFFDMGSLPSFQQDNRAKTVPFVNNHDTWRGAFSDSGGNGLNNQTGELKNKDELVSGTINPDDPRAPLAYAAIMAIDGNPQVYFEDLYENFNPNVRDNQDPDAVQPTRKYVENLVWCHQKLNFKDGAYRVPFRASGDLLIIERAGKAVVALNDNGAVAQGPQKIATSFGPNVQLHDYSGNVAGDVTTEANGDLTVPAVPPMRYCVWGPAGISGSFAGARVRRTTQEFRMDDDLGDKRPESLGYGGKLTAAADFRTAGAIWSAAGKTITVTVAPDAARAVELRVLLPDAATGARSSATAGQQAKTGAATPAASLSLQFVAPVEGYYTLGARLMTQGDPDSAASLVEYEAPAASDKIK
jgi:alpha-amylase